MRRIIYSSCPKCDALMNWIAPLVFHCPKCGYALDADDLRESLLLNLGENRDLKTRIEALQAEITQLRRLLGEIEELANQHIKLSAERGTFATDVVFTIRDRASKGAANASR